MALKLVLLAALLWICPVFPKQEIHHQKLQECFRSRKNKLNIVVDDESNSIVNSQNFLEIVQNLDGDPCIIFLPKNKSLTTKWIWPNMETSNGAILLHLSQFHFKNGARLLFLNGMQCNDSNIWKADHRKTMMESMDVFQNSSGSCEMVYANVEAVCKNSAYNKEYCRSIGPRFRNRYVVNVQKKECHWCSEPEKPSRTIKLDPVPTVYDTFDRSKANEVMARMHDLACSIKESSVALSGDDGAVGVLVRETEPDDVEGVAFGYSLNDSMSVTSNKVDALAFERSIIVPKEAFEQAISQNISVPFVAVMRFPNLEKDEMDSTLIGEPFAVEMGASINNLTESIFLTYKNLKYEGIPSCRSWNGQGRQPNWTDEGCETFHDGKNITCSCSHLTFFAVLLTPLNTTISTSNLSNLTIITKCGCAVSVIFLCIILFMHHLLRRTKVSVTAKLIIQLAYAILLLDLTFLVNEYVAGVNNRVGCVVMAAVMHWSMLAAFTWFSVQALHICLQLYKGSTVAIRHYFLKVSLASWVLPGMPVIVLLGTGKYGEQVINISEATRSASFCWITDGNAHYIVNIGYYVLVFLVTLTTFIIIMSFHYHVWRAKAGTEQADKSTRHVASLMGMCCILGITWGFAFFAYGVLQIPSYYIFTILNSFQGFFLFLYYYNARRADGDANSQSVSTLQITRTEDAIENPYKNQPQKQL